MLTHKKKLFCDYYLSNGFNGTKAAHQAGYKGGGDDEKKYLNRKAYSLLKEPEIKAYIDERKKELHDKILLSQEKLLTYLSRCVLGEELETKIVQNKFSYETVDIQISQRDRLKASELLFKYYDLGNNKKKNNVKKIQIVNDIKPQPEEEINIDDIEREIEQELENE